MSTLSATMTTITATVKFLFDVARLIPGLSSILGLEPVVVDGLALATVIEADVELLVKTPEWVAFLTDATKLFQSKGGEVVVHPVTHKVISYKLPPDYAGSHGKSMYQGPVVSK